MKTSIVDKTFVAATVLTGWFAISLQYYLILEARNGTPAEITIRFFSFFTVLTNILVAVSFTCLLFNWRKKGLGKFLTKPSTLTATTVYIVVVSLVYNSVLRGLVPLAGWNRVVDELLHLVVPVMAAVYWFAFVPKNTLQWKNAMPWTIYPLLYLVYVIIRGSIVGEYPYPFVNVARFGAGQVTLNCIVVCAVFLGASYLFIWVDKKMQIRNEVHRR